MKLLTAATCELRRACTAHRTSRRVLMAVAAWLIAGAAVPSDAVAQARAGARDFRWAKSLPAGQWVRVHNVSGDVKVTGIDGDRVEVVGIRRGGGGYDEDDVRVDVHEGREGVTVCALWGQDSWCDDRGSHIESHGDGRRRRGSVDFEVRLPRRLKLSANSVSGDVEVNGVGDEVRAGSVSGNVRLERVRAPRVSASSVSGDVDVQIDALTGAGDLRFTSVSGNVSLQLPRSLDADFTLRTVSGELESDFQLTLQGPMNRRSLSGRIGRGGRDLHLTTVSGDVRLRAR
jgi:lia operon protein LiaG